MWCTNCQQDVPAIACGETARCAKCGRFLRRSADDEGIDLGSPASVEFALNSTGSDSKHHAATANVDRNSESFSAESAVRVAVVDDEAPASKEFGARIMTLPSAGDEDWLLDQQVQNLRRRLRLDDGAGSASKSFADEFDLDRAARQSALQQTGQTIRDTSNSLSDAARSLDGGGSPTRPRPSILAWGLMGIGLMAFVCGGVLLAWSLLGRRGDLWNLGMPLTLAGQFGLLLGLVMQLDHLWQANRRTAESLDNVDRRLHDIKQAATLLHTPRAAPGQSFYAHWAEGAHPHLLLADLKGQLDMLSDKLAK
jgi:hypothetical protein